MKKNRFTKILKWIHKWPGIVVSLLLVFWAISGIVLNHRQTFSSININRNILAEEYQYNNWNNAALKGNVQIGQDSMLVYGNIGIWLSNDDFSQFQDFNNGFPSGIDHRKTFDVLLTSNNRLFAATLFGLYEYNLIDKMWKKHELDLHEYKIVALEEVKGELFVMSRSSLIKAALNDKVLEWENVVVPAYKDYDGKIGLFRTLWVIHSGEIYGKVGKLVVDAVALIFIFLVISGLIYFFAPGIIKRKKRKGKDNQRIKKINKFSISWHNKLGGYLIVFLLITTCTGMFLRPPLLIAIASGRVDKLPFTTLDDPNPWNDRFRDMLYDEEANRFFIGTVDGIYHSDDNFSSELKMFPVQVPISVMGINVLKKLNSGDYLVGSFLGLYRWQPERGLIWNQITGSRDVSFNRNGPPLGEFMSSGLLMNTKGSAYHIDYNIGSLPIIGNAMPPMPTEILSAAPMSLWNFSLEVHTGRFFKFLFGDFYILIVPLLGLLTFSILISGFIVWLKLLIRRTKRAK